MSENNGNEGQQEAHLKKLSEQLSEQIKKVGEERFPGVTRIMEELDEEVTEVLDHIFLKCHTDLHLITVATRTASLLNDLHPEIFAELYNDLKSVGTEMFRQAILENEDRLEWWANRFRNVKEKEETLGVRDEQEDSDPDAGSPEGSGEEGDDPVRGGESV